jgi:hypothetical protein
MDKVSNIILFPKEKTGVDPESQTEKTVKWLGEEGLSPESLPHCKQHVRY